MRATNAGGGSPPSLASNPPSGIERSRLTSQASIRHARRWDLTSGLVGLATDVLSMASVDDERFDIDATRALAEQLPRGALVELVGFDHRASARTSAVDAIVAYLEHGRLTHGPR